jgi:CRP-like cAMP-binding protein/Flp pilus assembly protein TadD
MAAASTIQEDLDSLIQVARSFAHRQMYAEAAELFQLGLRLDPRNSGLRMALAEMRRKQRQYLEHRPRSIREQLQEQFRRDAIDGAHFQGLAEFYAGKGETSRSLSCLDMARAKDPVNPSQHKLRGRILARRKQLDPAAEELHLALRFNPFDREVAESLSRIEYERRQFPEALDAAIQAFLLLNDGDKEGAERLRRRIRTLRQILDYDHEDLLRRFRFGQEKLEVAFDRLQWHRERFLEEGGLAESDLAGVGASSEADGGLIERAARIQQLGAFPSLTDPKIIQITAAAQEEFYESGQAIFRHGSEDADLYLLESGRIDFRRETSYGTFSLRQIAPGELFGETNFINGLQRTGEAVALEPVKLLRFDAAQLRRLLRKDAELGVHLYWVFWHTLAAKLRATNDKLRTFFTNELPTGEAARLNYAYPEAELQVEIDSDAKIRVLQEQGLSHGELMTLATFSREKRFPPGASIFEEGDQGEEMYVILDGKARISKYIAGAGEEALAILERGDFFGEMSLIDGLPRSADAKAHDGPLTVLAFDRSTFQEILSMDAHASWELLQLLCRLIARRLREMNSKLVGWSILAGPHREAVSPEEALESHRLKFSG